MDIFFSEQKELLPGVLLDKSSGKFQITGNSCPMEPFEFFHPILQWFQMYCRDPLDQTVLELNLNYFNSSSSKFFLRIFDVLEALHISGKDVSVKWYYDEADEDMLEEAEEFEYISGLDFELIPIVYEDQQSFEEELIELFDV